MSTARLLVIGLSLLTCIARGAVFTVTTTNDNGTGSLRQAILNANSNPGADSIHFNIAGANLQTIAPVSELPGITDGVTIDGYTQPGASQNTLSNGNNAVLWIEINGINAGTNAYGLVIHGANTTVSGLVINRFAYSAIAILGASASNNVVRGNFLGTDAAGMTARPNGFDGVALAMASWNTIGGATPGARNILSGNTNQGVWIGGNSKSNRVIGNFIGVNATGAQRIGSTYAGVKIDQSFGNTVGGTNTGEGNVISGNADGLTISSQSHNNQVLGNLIGLNAQGTQVVSNLYAGILITDAPFNTIGGTNAMERNVISGNDNGVVIVEPLSRGNRVLGNYLGTDKHGTNALRNRYNGIAIGKQAHSNFVGGIVAGAGNLASGNGASGIAIDWGAHNNYVQGNIVGLNAQGTQRLPNLLHGIALLGGSSNLIGGIVAGARNVIGGAGISGLRVEPLSTNWSRANVIQGNFFGTDITGTQLITNTGPGISVHGSSGTVIGGSAPGAGNLLAGSSHGVHFLLDNTNTTVIGNHIGVGFNGTAMPNAGNGVFVANGFDIRIGGDAPGEGNRIAYNREDGVYVLAGLRNAVIGNAIYGNTNHGIDLGPNGTTPNDANDNDTGGNNLQNFPIINSVSTGVSTMLDISLNSRPNTDYRIDFYVSAARDPSGYGEGETWIGFVTNITTSAAGTANFQHTPPYVVPVGHWVTATATDPAGSTSEFSQAVQALSNTEPYFLSQPTNRTVIATSNTIFAATTTGALPMSYQWFYNGYAISGATMASLMISNAQPVVAGNYYVVAQNSFGSVTSAVASFVVLARPTITQPLVNQTVHVGDNATFAGSFSGTAPFGIRWRRNSATILHQSNVFASSASFIVTNVTAAMHNQRYDLIVTNATGGVGVLSAAFLFVEQPASINGHPTNATAGVGGNVTFCVGASGSPPLNYQWRHNGASIAGATNACLTITNVQLTNGGAYSVVVENAIGAIASAPALLLISATPAPPGDNFNDRTSLENTSLGLVSGTNDFATKEPGEPDHAGKPGGRSVWYIWTAPVTGIATFRTAGSTFDTLLGIYTGTNLTGLAAVAGDEDSGGAFTSEAHFQCNAESVYAIAVDGFGGASGRYLLSWEVELTAEELPVIIAHPAGQTVSSNSPAAFSVSASGSGLGFQWFFNDAPLAGETNSVLHLNNVKTDDVGLYRVTVTNSVGRGAESRTATLEIGPQPGVRTQDKFEDLFLNGGPFALNARSPALLAGGILTVSAGIPITMFLNNTNSTTQQSELTECRIGGASRWITLRGDVEGVCVLDTQGSGIDTVLAVYTGSNPLALAPVVYEGITACNDNAATNVTWSRVRFLTVPGIEYRVQLDGANGQNGLVALNAALGQPPSFSPAPTNSLVAAGDDFVLESGVVNTADYSFQWLWNGRDIDGATNATLLIPNAGAGSGGVYSVAVRNQFGAATYIVASVQVEVPFLTSQGLSPAQTLRLLVQRPAGQALVIESSSDLRDWRPLHTVPLTVPGPVVELPWTNRQDFYRARPWP